MRHHELFQSSSQSKLKRSSMTSTMRLGMVEALIASHCRSVLSSQITHLRDLSLANALGSFFSPEHSLISRIFKFDSRSNSMGRSFKDLHNEISRNSSCWSAQMEGGSIDKLGHADNLSALSDLNLPKSSGNFWIRWQLVTDNFWR